MWEAGKAFRGQLDFPAAVWYIARGVSQQRWSFLTGYLHRLCTAAWPLPLCKDTPPGRSWTVGRFLEVDGMTSNCSNGRGNTGMHNVFACVVTSAFPGILIRATSRDYAFSRNKWVLARTWAIKDFSPVLRLHSSDLHLSPFDMLWRLQLHGDCRLWAISHSH